MSGHHPFETGRRDAAAGKRTPNTAAEGTHAGLDQTTHDGSRTPPPAPPAPPAAPTPEERPSEQLLRRGLDHDFLSQNPAISTAADGVVSRWLREEQQPFERLTVFALLSAREISLILADHARAVRKWAAREARVFAADAIARTRGELLRRPLSCDQTLWGYLLQTPILTTPLPILFSNSNAATTAFGDGEVSQRLREGQDRAALLKSLHWGFITFSLAVYLRRDWARTPLDADALAKDAVDHVRGEITTDPLEDDAKLWDKIRQHADWRAVPRERLDANARASNASRVSAIPRNRPAGGA